MFERRLRAYSIDSSFAVVAAIISGMFLSKVEILSNELKLGITLIIYILVMVIPNLFSRGQTFGKRIEKMKVVYKTEELVAKEYVVPPLIILILRELVKAALTFITVGLYAMLAGIIATNRQDGRTIHDFIFKTRVIALTKYTTDSIGLKTTSSVSERLKGSSYND